MYYIVNKETKEHRVSGSVTPWGWHAVEADDQGWIKWDGGECPLPMGSPVEVRRGDGVEFHKESATTLSWSPLDRDGYSIIAYRPACYHEHKEGGSEWNREGLPPVGASVRVSVPMTGVKCNADVVGHHCGRAVVWMHSDMSYMALHVDYLHPIQTPEQRAEEVAIEAMVDEVPWSNEDHDDWALSAFIYAAIRDGKIPGVKLDQ